MVSLPLSAIFDFDMICHRVDSDTLDFQTFCLVLVSVQHLPDHLPTVLYRSNPSEVPDYRYMIGVFGGTIPDVPCYGQVQSRKYFVVHSSPV